MVKIKKKRKLKYLPHLITSIGILGLRELVKEKSPNFISRAIRQVVEATALDDKIRKANEENYTQFPRLVVEALAKKYLLPPSNKRAIESRGLLLFLILVTSSNIPERFSSRVSNTD
jgi:hypothetical protein